MYNVYRHVLESETDTGRHAQPVRFLDLTVMNNARRDRHIVYQKDCLHYCLPGPIDDWARLLMAFWT